ncbi:hypothetical protein NI18_13655 [Sphingomonas sp. Ant20]|nr:hypothetical protein NI18_13655 [Sphingomonas sp. Ant20]
MTSTQAIELFILKSAVITRELNRVMSTLKVTNVRSALERETDTLISGYIDQINFEIVSNAERMAEFYKVFFALENDIRNLVEETLQSERGDEWWSNAVPQSVRENAQKNIDREASEGLPPRSTRPIEYTTFGELNDIIKENWTSFSGIFSRVSKNRVLRVLIRLNHARGPIAHSNLLPEEEAVRLKLAVRDWYKLME